MAHSLHTYREEAMDKRNDYNRLHKYSGGFTLVELLIVVAIIGVLAAIAAVAYNKYVEHARESEAVGFIGNIRLKQEAYRMTFHQYANVSQVGYAPVDIAVDPNVGEPRDFTQAVLGNDEEWKRWMQLGARPDGPVRFRYATIAGDPGVFNPAKSFGFDHADVGNFFQNDYWFAAIALGKSNPGQPDYVCYITFTQQDEIVREKPCKAW